MAPDTVYFTHESSQNGPARLWSLYMDLDVSVANAPALYEPFFHVSGNDVLLNTSEANVQVQVFTEEGKLVKNAVAKNGRISALGVAPGLYVLKATIGLNDVREVFTIGF